MELMKVVSPIRALFGSSTGTRGPGADVSKTSPPNVIREKGFPDGYHVYGIAQGPDSSGQVLIGAGDPLTSEGSVFLGTAGSLWEVAPLPDETALLSTFLRLKDGRYLAGGMTSIGRGAVLVGDRTARKWKPINVDLHPYSSIAFLTEIADGSLLASTGQMVTQGKTKPVLFRSIDQGSTWTKEEQSLPVTLFMSIEEDEDGTLYLGTCGDHTPMMVRSRDGARTFEPMPDFPAYKTYKMLSLKLVKVNGQKRLFVVLWGYKTDIADRVVRIYMSNAEFTAWEELPPVDDSHFVFSFLVASDGTFYAGSEKGKIYKSEDYGRSWKCVTQFSTNIGAYALYEDSANRIWIGKDFVEPSECSLWRLG